jgi:hypothetical protein
VVDAEGSLQGILAVDDVLRILVEAQLGAMQLLRGRAAVERAYVAGAAALAQPQAEAGSQAGAAGWRHAA